MNYSKKKSTALNIIKKRKIKILLKEQKNNECFECSNLYPEYISLNNGIFLCRNCVLDHINLPKSISYIIKNNLRSLTLNNIQYLCCGGNQKLIEFINIEYPNLKKFPPRFLYRTFAMDYYRKWLEYLIEGGIKPIKPDINLAYELIKINNNDLENKNFINDNNINRKIISDFQRTKKNKKRNINKIKSEGFMKLQKKIHPKIKPIVGSKNTFRYTRSLSRFYNNLNITVGNLNNSLDTDKFNSTNIYNDNNYGNLKLNSSTDFKNRYSNNMNKNYDTDDINKTDINELTDTNTEENNKSENYKLQNKITKKINNNISTINNIYINRNNIYSKPIYQNYLNTFQNTHNDNFLYDNKNDNNDNNDDNNHLVNSIGDLRNYISSKNKKNKKININNINNINNNIIINRNLNIYYNNNSQQKIFKKKTIGNSFSINDKKQKIKQINNSKDKKLFLMNSGEMENDKIFNIKPKYKNEWNKNQFEKFEKIYTEENQRLDNSYTHNNIFTNVNVDNNINMEKIKVNRQQKALKNNNTNSYSSNYSSLNYNSINYNNMNYKNNNYNNSNYNSINENERIKFDNENLYGQKSKIIQRISRVLKTQKEREEKLKSQEKIKVKINQKENNINNSKEIEDKTPKDDKKRNFLDPRKYSSGNNHSKSNNKINQLRTNNLSIKELINTPFGKKKNILDIIRSNNLSQKIVSPHSKRFAQISTDPKNINKNEILAKLSIEEKFRKRDNF